jgi:DNA-binding NarL/FixJ family response regulator
MRECLCRCIGEKISSDKYACSSMAEWMADAPVRAPSVALLSLAGVRADDDDDGFADLRALLDAYPSLPVVIIADGDSLDDVRLAIGNGAKGYISTNTTPAVAVEAVQLVLAGGVYVPAACLLSSSNEPVCPAINRRSLSMFTARQTAVIEAIRMGKANKIIAYELNMRESTVKVHVRNIMKRLNARNRTEVAYLANKLLAGGSIRD